MVHVAIVGTGRVGSALAYTLAFKPFVDELSLADIVPKLAEMVKEDVYHGISQYGINKKISAYEHSKFIENADLIVISAGFPRTPDMTRRDLADKNAQIMKEVVEATLDNNPKAWYFVITNPVDAMTTLVNKVAGGKRKVIGTGTNLETSRFRIIIARELGIPVSSVEAYVGGEHGKEATLLWSTVYIEGKPLDEYLAETGKTLDKSKVEGYVKGISVEIIRATGGTRWGPAGSFTEIIRGIILNTGRVLSYSLPRKLGNVPEPVYVTVPARIGKSLGPDIWDRLSEDERAGIIKAAEAIYGTYKRSLEVCGLA
ncbi:MAG: malate dehydrogenase [Candidatus Asgardarchaeia archaeon]